MRAISNILHSKHDQAIYVISPSASVYDALRLMAEKNLGALIVLEDDKIVGILSERDYARKGPLMGHASRETQVHQIMTTPVVFITPRHTVDECMAMMTQRHFRHLPVLQGDAVIGVISIGDMVKWVISDQAQTIQTLEGYISGAYPG